jgi:hypothetical protein
MIVTVVKALVEKHTKAELDDAIAKFESSRENVFGVEGKDDGEKLSNLLAASAIRARVDRGMPLNEAVREHSSRVRGILAKPSQKPGG